MQPYHDSSFLQEQYKSVLNASSCNDLACLRGLSASDLEKSITASYYTAYAAGLYAYGDMFFGPSVDNKIIHDLPSVEFTRGHFSKVPLLTNHDSFEGKVVVQTSIHTVILKSSRYLIHQFLNNFIQPKQAAVAKVLGLTHSRILEYVKQVVSLVSF